METVLLLLLVEKLHVMYADGESSLGLDSLTWTTIRSGIKLMVGFQSTYGDGKFVAVATRLDTDQNQLCGLLKMDLTWTKSGSTRSLIIGRSVTYGRR